MNSRKLQSNSVQFDYFSENFMRFEQDYYAYSTMDTPLTFITDDILLAMSEAQINYFRLPASKAKDNKNHYFIFKVKMQENNKQVRTYEYVRHASAY
ncbi:hypothetical protein HYQ40_05395 [Aerococcaceae bacterium DSM 111021]|nr:hypothetical protein [Aerococcaceae bacterium DSM 111021]